MRTIPVPRFVDRMAARLLAADDMDFTRPRGEPAMVGPDSVSWRVFRNPVSMTIGGIAAVLLELAEPRVRHGVWDHSSFKRDPGTRMRRTGMAAMMTVYGPQSAFEALAARVHRMHGKVTGVTPEGLPYQANDPELLLWVQVTASWAFVEAYRAYAAPVSAADRDRYYAEAKAGSALYGVENPPASAAAVEAVFAAMTPKLGPTPILDELIAVLRSAPLLPLAMRPLQPVLVRAAIDLVPEPLRERIGVARYGPLRKRERALLTVLARGAERVHLPSSPAAQAAVRLGLASDHVARSSPRRLSPAV
ncbi:MAG: oxygenase MpaB family protein [Pseudomonadota bacterium]